MKWNFLIGTGLCMMSMVAMAQPAKDSASAVPVTYSLKQAQEYAVANNLNIKNAMLDLETAKKKIWETTAIGLPQVTATGNYQYIFKVPEMNFPGTILTQERHNSSATDPLQTINGVPTGTPGDSIFITSAPGRPITLGVQSNFTWDITVSQLIFSGEYLVGLQASRVFKELSEQALTKSQFDTKETVSNAYYLVLVGEENLQLLRNNRSLVEKTLVDISAMKNQGFMEETDVDQIRITKLNLDNLINSLEEQTQVAYRLLKFQMGLDLSQQISLSDSLQGLINTGNFNLWSKGDFDVQKNIDFELMKTQESLAMLSLKREKSKYLPSVNGIYKHQAQLNSAAFNFFMPDIVAVGISFPLFTSGMRNAQVKEARLALEKATNNKNLAMQGLLIQYDQSVSAYNKALKDYISFKESMNLTDRVYKKTLLKYKEGMATSLELTQAQSQFFVSEGSYYNAIVALFNAQSKLEKLTETK